MGVELARELRIQLVSNQPQYSMLWRVIEGQVVPACEQLGVSQIVWSPLAQGVLTGKYLPGAPVPEGSRATDEKGGANFVARFLEDDVLTQVQLLKPLAAEAGISMAQLALAWILRNQNVASAIVGATRPEQLEDSVGALAVTLEDELVEQVDAILQSVMIDDPELTEKMTPQTRV